MSGVGGVGRGWRPNRSVRVEWAGQEAGSGNPANWLGESSMSNSVSVVATGISRRQREKQVCH